jgi:hypothetical protein
LQIGSSALSSCNFLYGCNEVTHIHHQKEIVVKVPFSVVVLVSALASLPAYAAPRITDSNYFPSDVMKGRGVVAPALFEGRSVGFSPPVAPERKGSRSMHRSADQTGR